MKDPLPKMVRVNAGRPCPVCKKAAWCLVCPTGKSAICSRVESRKKCGEAGWLHRLDEPIPSFTPPPKREVARGDWYKTACELAERLPAAKREELAVSLGLPPDALGCLTLLGLHEDRGVVSVVFPERDGSGQVIGLNRRLPDGRKLHLPGGGRGITLPAGWKEIASGRPLYVVEGPTDTAAMVAAGLNAIGRPSNRGGVEFLARAMQDVEDRVVVILGENDRRWSEDFNRWDWPGLVGCMAVAGELAPKVRQPVFWALPPTDYKDAREYLTGEQFDGVTWPDRGKAFEAELTCHPAKHVPAGYTQYAAEADKKLGFDESRWRE